MSYQDALDFYGTDKPDLRYDYLIQDYSEFFQTKDIPLFAGSKYVKGIKVNTLEPFTRKQIDQLTELVKKHHGKALAFLKVQDMQLSGSIAKFLDVKDLEALELEDQSLLFLVPGRYEDVTQSLGALREKLAEILNIIPKDVYKFVWITDWPLLEYNEEEGRFYAKHHPFTQPKDPQVLKDNPKEAYANAYDIVLNGYEIGGGSMRIYDQEVQQLMFETLGLKASDIKERFGFFVDALKYGTPPHGGIALGLDRIVMLMTHTNNIKDVIAFPKTQSAKDVMMQAPSEVDSEQLNELKLKVGE
jgi:aspartyl-tRNA synthetase